MKVNITGDNEIIIEDDHHPITRFTVSDFDPVIKRYSVKDLYQYYIEELDVFYKVMEDLQDKGFHKRYDDELGVSVFACQDYSILEEQYHNLKIK